VHGQWGNGRDPLEIGRSERSGSVAKDAKPCDSVTGVGFGEACDSAVTDEGP